jgi:hypothetical protein
MENIKKDQKIVPPILYNNIEDLLGEIKGTLEIENLKIEFEDLTLQTLHDMLVMSNYYEGIIKINILLTHIETFLSFINETNNMKEEFKTDNFDIDIYKEIFSKNYYKYLEYMTK